MPVLMFWPAMALMAHAAAFVQFAIDITKPVDQARLRRRSFRVIQGGKNH
jgi:hypothetical protein